MDPEKQNELHQKAVAAFHQAYAPYSKFQVGAAILSSDGQIYSGCNVENAAYPLGNCAEAGAISQMLLGGSKQIEAIMVVGRGKELVTPCGGCRQKIREFALSPGAGDTQILIGDLDGLRKSFSLSELLPASFGPENL